MPMPTATTVPGWCPQETARTTTATSGARLVQWNRLVGDALLMVGTLFGEHNHGMATGSGTIVSFRLWPPVAIGGPLVLGWWATAAWGDPVDLGSWRTPVGWVLVGLFVLWNGWSLWLFGSHETGLLPGQETTAMIERGPYRLSRNPLYVGLLALHLALALLIPSFWALVALPVSVALIRWGAILPEERFLRERFGAPYVDYTRRVRRWF
jgi:protein-S-isoprenylcysteine O-methyltransferase Ste14